MRTYIFLAMLLTAGCSKHCAEIDPGAVSVMTIEHWPGMYAALGPAAFARANAKMQAAADFAAADAGCDRIDYVGVSQSGSRPDRIEWFVDCGSDYRVRLSEDDLALKV